MSSVDTRIRDMFDAQRLRTIEQLSDPDLRKGDGGGTSGGMEPRVARLESDMGHVKDTLKSLDGRVEAIRADIVTVKVDLSSLKAKVDHLPSKGFIFSVATGLLAAVATLTAVIVRFIPHV